MKKCFHGIIYMMLVILPVLLMGCANDGAAEDTWEKEAGLSLEESEEDLYEAALKEDILIVYTVTTRVTTVKEAFEKKYPGLSVEIRDLRSSDLVEAVREHCEKMDGDCDIVICNDNSGRFRSELTSPGLVVPYISSGIRSKMKAGYAEDTITFLDEAEMLFYNAEKYQNCPITNIWELTEPEYEQKIYIPNPLRSFSTYAFLGSISEHEAELTESYIEYYGKEPELTAQQTIYELFSEKLSANVVFTNSSDEVCEMLGNENGQADFGIMVSSKMRLTDYGYHFKPVYHLEPFSGCKISFSIMIGKGSKNVNAAKLFVRFLLGGEDGTGEGYQPFVTAGTWSARTDVADGNDVSLEEADFLVPNQEMLIEKREYLEQMWSKLISK